MAAKASYSRRTPRSRGVLPDVGEAIHRRGQRARRVGAMPTAARESPKRPCIATISAGLSRDAAKEATAAAEMHKQLAGVAR